MLSRLLHACGLYLGPESALMPPQADNPEGFWEHLGFVALNDELLNQLGGAWDLPPKIDDNFGDPRLDPLRMKARLLIEEFDSARVWGWKDPRNSLTLPFWHNALPELKTLLVVRNPLEVAHSMRERNGTSYSFGLRLWEIYNRRVMEAVADKQRLVTHYDSFFKDAESELRRIAQFLHLPDTAVRNAAALVSGRRRHTHFTIDALIDAGVSAEIIELYRALSGEASTGNKAQLAKTPSTGRGKSDEPELLAGSVSRINAFVPEKIAQVEHLYRELLAQAEARHKEQVEQLANHLAKTEARHKEQVEETEARHKKQVEEMVTHLAKTEAGHKKQVEELTTHLAKTELLHKKQVEELTGHYNNEIAQLRERVLHINELLRERSVSLTESETRQERLKGQLIQQFKVTKKLSRLLDDTESAAGRLRSSTRWQIANPISTLKAKLSSSKSQDSLGYGHLEKIVAAYRKWRSSHPEMATMDDEIKALVSTAGLSSAQSKTLREPSAPTQPIEFPVHEQVEVSIVIPVFNQLHFTQACLASLQEHQESERFEVIVVDDCSTDATAESVAQIPGVVYLRNESNSGFIASCNRGAEAARGKYLVFLNNDTLVKQGWLTSLLETFKEEARAGIVGSKLLYPDGRLQEAGGIIWQDASGWNYGKFDDAGKPKYNYLREVDYCSGAALMIPKALFESAGGFDSRYAPGYYEDTDLAFKVRQAGYKVLYQPLSEVIHHEGATGGTDIFAGAKKHQEINRSIFAEAWTNELAKRPVNGDLSFLKRPATASGKNILVIDHHLPMPDRDSGSLRMFQILKILRRLGHHVTFLPDNLADIPPYTRELQKRGIEVVHYPYVKKVSDYLVSHGSIFDAVVLSRCDFASKHLADVRLHAPQSRIIFDTVDLHYLREEREAQLTQDPGVLRRARERQQLEDHLIEQADETWVVSPIEQRLLQQKLPHKSIHVVSNIVDTTGSKTPFALRRDWLFIGGFQHRPNTDAVLFFVENIYPFVHDHLPDAKFYIIGDKAPPEILRLANDNIIVAGLQRDARSFFDSVRLSVAPLRFGAGIKGKINQSMALGVPVVATSLAVEGMGLIENEDILVADDPKDFARRLVELYESEELWNRLSENGIKKTRALYSTDAARKKLEFLFSDEHLGYSQGSAPVPEPVIALAAKC